MESASAFSAMTTRDDDFNPRPDRIGHGNEGAKRPKSCRRGDARREESRPPRPDDRAKRRAKGAFDLRPGTAGGAFPGLPIVGRRFSAFIRDVVERPGRAGEDLELREMMIGRSSTKPALRWRTVRDMTTTRRSDDRSRLVHRSAATSFSSPARISCSLRSPNSNVTRSAARPRKHLLM